MSPAEILKPICSTDDARPALFTPFGMDFKGHRWLAATNGHIAVALLGDAELRKDAPDMAALLNDAPSPNFRASVSALSKWAGPVPPPPTTAMVDCEECDGEGEVFCDQCNRPGAECEECGGEGKVSANAIVEPRYGAIFSGVLNRVLLSRVLATLPEGTTEVRIGQREPLAPYILRAKGWLAAIMPMMRDVKASEKFTELEPVTE